MATMTLTSAQIDIIVDRLYKKMSRDVKEITSQMVLDEKEEYLCVKDVARILKCCPMTVYNRKDDIGCYIKSGHRILFPKSQLHRAIQAGKF